MALEPHIESLELKHQALEAELGELMNSPSASDLSRSEVKRRKLQLKDEIQRLRMALAA